MCKYVSFAAIAATLALGISGAHAYTSDTADLTVQAYVTSTCSVNAATLNFGAVLTTKTDVTNTSTQVVVDCRAPYKLTLGNGLNSLSGRRRVHNVSGTSETSYIGYVLNGQNDQPWNNNVEHSGGTVTIYGVLDAPIEGQIEGSYTDTVSMTLTY